MTLVDSKVVSAKYTIQNKFNSKSSFQKSSWILQMDKFELLTCPDLLNFYLKIKSTEQGVVVSVGVRVAVGAVLVGWAGSSFCRPPRLAVLGSVPTLIGQTLHKNMTWFLSLMLDSFNFKFKSCDSRVRILDF